jgi:ribosomal protein L11 methyltransferase
MTWIEVRLVSSVDAGELLGLLDDQAMVGAWQEDHIIHLYWRHDHWSADRLLELKRVLHRLGEETATLAIDAVEEQDWNALWTRSVTPLRIGRRIVIRPSWERVTLGPSDFELILDPKQAFGTGHHATTRLLIEQLEAVVQGGEQVLDVGTGSGILAMVALRLGARSALAIDHDPVAIDCARGYAADNDFGSELQFCTLRLEQVEPRPFDLVLANLDRRTLLALCPGLPRFVTPDGTLLCSGILVEDRQDIEAAFASVGGVVKEQRELDGWIALEILFEGPRTEC